MIGVFDFRLPESSAGVVLIGLAAIALGFATHILPVWEHTRHECEAPPVLHVLTAKKTDQNTLHHNTTINHHRAQKWS